VVVLTGRVELVGPVDPAAIDHHDDRCAGFLDGRPPLMAVWTPLLGLTVGHDCIEDVGGAILDGPHDTQQPAAGDTTPGAIAPPRLPFEGLRAFALPRAQWASAESTMIAPRRAWYSRAASARAPDARSAG